MKDYINQSLTKFPPKDRSTIGLYKTIRTSNAQQEKLKNGTNNFLELKSISRGLDFSPRKKCEAVNKRSSLHAKFVSSLNSLKLPSKCKDYSRNLKKSQSQYKVGNTDISVATGNDQFINDSRSKLIQIQRINELAANNKNLNNGPDMFNKQKRGYVASRKGNW